MAALTAIHTQLNICWETWPLNLRLQNVRPNGPFPSARGRPNPFAMNSKQQKTPRTGSMLGRLDFISSLPVSRTDQHDRMKNLFRYLFSKVFIINAVVALAIIAGLLYVVFSFLESYTMHGESITVPDFTGLKLEELDEFAENHQIQYVIVDSVYNSKKPKGAVVDQDPPGNFQVKQNRKIYLTVNATQPQMKAVPNLIDASTRATVARLEALGFEVGELIYKPTPKCVDCLLGFERNGKTVEPGSMVPFGSTLDLVLGQGEGGERQPVPILLGMDYNGTQTWLKEHSLNTGAIVIDSASCKTASDSAQSIVYRQSPMYGEDAVISLGGELNIWCTCSRELVQSSVPDSILRIMQGAMPVDSTAVDSTAVDSTEQ